MAYDRLKKLLAPNTLEMELEDERIERDLLKKKAEREGILENIGGMVDSLAKIGTYRGEAPNFNAAKVFREGREKAEKGLESSHGRRKDLLGRLQTVEGIEAEEKDKEFQRSEAVRKEDKADKTYEDKIASAGLISPFEKEKRDRDKTLYDIKVEEAGRSRRKDFNALPGVKALISMKDKGDILEQQLDDIRALGNTEEAYNFAKTTLGQLNTLAKEGSDAIGAEEAERLGAGLSHSLSNLAKLGATRDIGSYLDTVENALTAVRKAANRGMQKKRKMFESGALIEEDTIDTGTDTETDIKITAPLELTQDDVDKIRNGEEGEEIILDDGDVAIISVDNGRKGYRRKSEFRGGR